MTFRFLAPAQAELLEAISYYAAINADLGVRFEEAGARADILIVAVAHQRKRPEYWSRRL